MQIRPLITGSEFVTTRATLSHRDFQSIDSANPDHGSPPSSPPRLIPSHIDTQFQTLSCRKSLSRKRIGSQKSRASTLVVRSDMSSVQRLILRMDRASRETMLQRIQEAWIMPLDESQQYEIELEKFLWVLAALNLRCYESTLRIPTATPSTDLTSFLHRSGNLLELAHGIGEPMKPQTIKFWLIEESGRPPTCGFPTNSKDNIRLHWQRQPCLSLPECHVSDDIRQRFRGTTNSRCFNRPH